jgi:hypothetical protein
MSAGAPIVDAFFVSEACNSSCASLVVLEPECWEMAVMTLMVAGGISAHGDPSSEREGHGLRPKGNQRRWKKTQIASI